MKATSTQEERLAKVNVDHAEQLKELKRQQQQAVEQAKHWPDFLPTISAKLALHTAMGTNVKALTHIEQMFLNEDQAATPLLKIALEHRQQGNLEEAYAQLKSTFYCFTLSDNITRKWSKIAFSQGTHVRLGAHSGVLRLAGKYHVCRLIFSYLTIDAKDESIRVLPAKVMCTMAEVQIERGEGGHAYTMAQVLGAYNCSHPKFFTLMMAALDTEEGWSGYNPLLERKTDRSMTRNAVAGMAENVESMASMFKGNRSIACLFTMPGKFLSNPTKYALMEQARSIKTIQAFANKTVICVPDLVDKDLQLTVSLVPITCGQWTGSQSGQGLTFVLDKLYMFDMEGDGGRPVKLEHFHMCIADGTAGTGNRLEQPPHGHATKTAMAFALERIPHVLYTLKEMFGIFPGRVLFGQGLTELGNEEKRNELVATHMKKKKEQDAGKNLSSEDEQCEPVNWPMTDNYFWTPPNMPDPVMVLVASPTTNASEMSMGMGGGPGGGPGGPGGGEPNMQEVMQMLGQLGGGGNAMLQQLMMQGLGNNAVGDGQQQQQMMMQMMQQMLGQPPGQEEGEGEPGQCPTQ
jgi:hypothetical protein